MNLGQKIRSGAKWLLLGSVAGRLMNFIFGVVLARLLFPADFGAMVTVSVFTGVAGMVMSGGMGQSLIRAQAVNEADFNAVFTLQLGIGILAYGIFFLASPRIGEFLNDPLYCDLIRVSALSFLLRPFSYMRGAWLSRKMDFKKRSMMSVANGAITGASSIAMAWHGMGVWSLLFAGIIGALCSNLFLLWITPLRLKLSFDLAAMRRHRNYGLKITINDFLTYLTRESKNLILSKLAGPAFVGIFNKGESLARMPNDLIMPSAMQPTFRALSSVQDDLDQTKYMYYRAIALLTVYTGPLYVGLWWIAEPFILVVYGEKWLAAAAPVRILVLAGFFFNVWFPSSRLLEAQNRLTQAMKVATAQLVVVSSAVFIGIQWGQQGVAWGLVISQIFVTSSLYYLVCRTIRTRLGDLVEAVAPGILLNVLLCVVLAILHFTIHPVTTNLPSLYVVTMSVAGFLCYVTAFMLLPLPALGAEVTRWRQQLRIGLNLITGKGVQPRH